jgi:AcrR family transcriptional regulator
VVTTDATTPRSLRPSADATRKKILSAALDVFAERSFDGAATREIASRAGVTQPLLNYHFNTKEKLWRAAVDDLFGSLEHALATRSEGLRGVDELTTAKLLVREFIHFSARHPQLHRIITGECKVDGPRMDWLTDHHTRPLFEATTAMFTRLSDAGHMAPIPAVHAYYILTGAGPTIFVLGPECRRLSGLDPADDEVLEAHADAVVALLFGR